MTRERLMERLSAASDRFVAPTLLQPADLFVDLAGEEFRKRLFLTEAADGAALCLRPDFTIPVCLEHLARGGSAPASYAYRGKIFRKRRAIGAPEFEQAGTEWIGHPNEEAADAAVFGLALECARDIALPPRARLGDAHLFAAVTAALGLPAMWQARLRSAFGDTDRLAGALARLARKTEAFGGLAARLAPALSRVDPEEARAIVDAVVGLPHRGADGGRTAEEIAARLLEEAAGDGADPAASMVCAQFLKIAAPLRDAVGQLERFAAQHQLDLSAAIERFARRADAILGTGVAADELRFEAGFGRRLNYYTGFVFEMVHPREPRAEVIAGGRYDGLIALLAEGRTIPAVGFSVWLDRLPEADR